MNGKQLSGTTVGFGISVAITSILSMLLVFIKETHEETILKMMKNATSHHWITHGVIAVVLFVIIGLILSKLGGGKGIEMKPSALVGMIVAAAIISFVGISGFYLLEG